MKEFHLKLLNFNIKCYFEDYVPTPFFNQEIHIFRTDSNRKMELTIIWPILNNHSNFQQYAFNSTSDLWLSTLQPREDLIIKFHYKGSKKLLNTSKILNTPSAIQPEGILIHRDLYQFLSKYKIAPHITFKSEILKKGALLDDNFLCLYFLDHGCNQINWNKSIFTYKYYKNCKELTSNDVFQINSTSEYMNYINSNHKGFAPLSLTIFGDYDLFFCRPAKSSILISSHLLKGMAEIMNYSEISISSKYGLFFEIILDDLIRSNS